MISIWFIISFFSQTSLIIYAEITKSKLLTVFRGLTLIVAMIKLKIHWEHMHVLTTQNAEVILNAHNGGGAMAMPCAVVIMQQLFHTNMMHHAMTFLLAMNFK